MPADPRGHRPQPEGVDVVDRRPAEAAASVAASVSRSSTPLSHSSPNWVHPMPMTATWSRIPLLAMAGPFLGRGRAFQK